MSDDVVVSLNLSNYELLWPASLFISEGERVLRSAGSWQDRAVWLMTEALAGTTAVADFEDLPNHTAPTSDPWATTATGWGTKRAVMDQHD